MSIEPVTATPPRFDRRAVLQQRWDELAYFHWPYDPAVVQELLPAGVHVDTYDGVAWVGVIPFEMRRVRLGPTPPIPYLSRFIEINVRTYVVDRLGRRAVWFFSLDVPRVAIVAVARTAFSLPYCWSKTSHEVDGSRHRYEMARRAPHGARPWATIEFDVGDRIPAHELEPIDHFLTARWSLLTTRRGRVLRGAVDHPPWPLHRVDNVEVTGTVVEAAGLPAPQGAPIARYSPGVAVRVAWFETVAGRGGAAAP
jgi:uncharacterized protein